MNATTHNETSSVQRLEQEIDRLERVVSIGLMLNSTLNLPLLLDTITRTVTELIETEGASILLLDERTGELFFVASADASSNEIKQIKVPIQGSIAGTIFQTGEPLVIDDVQQDRRHYGGVDQSLSFETRSILGVPLQLRGRRIGVLEAINKVDGRPFSEDDVRVLSVMASHAATAIENARLVSSLRDANRRLAKLDKLKSNFISIASHELRTPLMIVQGYASYLREQAGADISQDLDRVIQGARKLQTVIDQMTNLDYLEAGLSELQAELFDLKDLITEVIQNWKPLLDAKRQELKVRMPDHPVYVLADRPKIALVLGNLINNASKFTSEAGRVEVSVVPRTGRVIIVVSDTGVGIPQEELTQIFDSFYQVEDHLTRHYGGLGLGLTIAKQIVEQHGGRIWAESVRNEGSRFMFSLPAQHRP